MTERVPFFLVHQILTNETNKKKGGGAPGKGHFSHPGQNGWSWSTISDLSVHMPGRLFGVVVVPVILFYFFLNRNVGSEELVNQLVNELVRVSVEPQLRGHGRLVEMVTLVAALARLDEHDRSGEAFAVGAGEGDGGGARATRPAAAAVSAHSAVVGPVQASAPAAGVGQTVRLGGLVGSGALPSFLWRHGVKGRKGGVSK